MKKWLTLLMLLLVLLMSACATAQVSYRLNEDHTIDTNFIISIESGNTDAAQYTNVIMQYWTDKGFTPALTENDGILTLTGTKRDAYNSSAAAADAFAALLTAEDSLFHDAKFFYTPSHKYDTYSLTATVSLKDIIRQNEAQKIPQGEINQLESAVSNGTYTLSIALPGEVVSTNADSTQDGVCSWTLTYGSVTEITLETSTFNQENIDHYAALTAQQQRDTMLLLVCGIAAGVLFLALVIAVIIRKRKDRPLKVHVKKF